MALELNGTTGVSLVQDDTITDAKLALDANASEVKDALNATGSAPIYACRAWVNFNGTGTVAIRASGNVSSITDNGTGDYTLNFTTAMPDGNYALAGMVQFADDGTNNGVVHAIGIRRSVAPATSSCRFTTTAILASSSGMTDEHIVSVAIFR